VLEFRVTRYGDNGRNIVLSRRQILEEQGARAAEETRKKLVPDAVLPGIVVSLADFGAFVDLGGVQGLVPMSELSHSRVGRAGDRLRLGETVTVKVLRVDEAKGKITLSLKALEGDPWIAVPGRLHERQVVRGRAVRATEFGLFVELLPNTLGPLMVEASLRMTYSIGVIAALAYLGLSADPNGANWGTMIQQNQLVLAVQPWGAVAPIIAIALLTMGTGLIGDGIARTAAGIDRSRGAE